jgi:endoglucanase
LVGNDIHGVIGAPPAYLEGRTNQDKARHTENLFIDIGARDEAEARTWGVSEGDQVTFVNPPWQLGSSERICGKAIDDRIGCAVLLQLMTNLASVQVPLTVCAVISVQEEATMSGAGMVSYRVQPDFAVALDTVPSFDTPDASFLDAAPIALGNGVVLQLAEGVPQAYRGTFVHPGVRDLLIRTAIQERIPYQLSALYGYWTTDAAAVHDSRSGIPTGFVSIPRRYAHSPSEVLDINDAVAALRLLEAVVLKTGVDVDLRFVADLDA